LGEIITIKDLHYSYPDGHCALKGVNLKVKEGETLAIVGPNGAGKSTLLLHFNGILRSDNGAVKVLGMVVNNENLKNIRSQVGLVFQDPDDQLFSPTVYDDVAFGPINMGLEEGKIKQEVTQALGAVGLNGYQQRLSHHLSFGEKKRAAIATVLSMSPRLLVLDEPTSNMDPATKWSVIDILKKLSVTKIVVSHDLEMVRELCRRVVVFNDGRIIADGNTEQILGDKELLKKNGLCRPFL
jgi:cobalt/nickel transport system ATP-binding protein